MLYLPNTTTQQPPVAVNDTGFVTSTNQVLQLAAAQLLANDTDPNGDPLTLTTVQNPTNGTVSFNSGTGVVTFTPTNGYNGPASFTYSISDGQGGTATASVSLNVAAASSGASLFPADAVPTTITANDSNSVELGMKFVPAVSGNINGIRFYKGPQNTGLHTGRLWTAGGVEIAGLAFSNESASGWQTAQFTNPPRVIAGNTYVVSYHTSGFYSLNQNFFASPVTAGQLTAPSSSQSAGNGVFAYGAASLFPAGSFNASNYWVDVLFSPISGNLPPNAVNDYNFETTVNTPLQILAATLLANDSDPNGDTLVVTGVSSPSQGTASFNSGTNTVTFTPANNYVGNASFSYSISDGQAGTASATAHLFVLPTGTRLFPANALPATITVNDPAQVELGMRFVPAVNGVIKAIRFFKGPQNIGSHTGTLWSGAGGLLSSVTFSNESPSGWQTAVLPSPISVTGGQTYVVSYHTSGFYSATSNGFSSPITVGNLSAPATSNGVFAYGPTSFPTGTFNATNYWVDVIFG